MPTLQIIGQAMFGWVGDEALIRNKHFTFGNDYGFATDA
jgi:hypothetical protein